MNREAARAWQTRVQLTRDIIGDLLEAWNASLDARLNFLR